MSSPENGPAVKNTARAFTLVEILVTLSIVILLVALAVPGIQKAGAMLRSTQCLGNLRQTGLTAGLYAQDHNGYTPRLNYWWPRELWSYVYGDDDVVINYPSQGLPSKLADTIFECPQAHADEVALKRSYGINQRLLNATAEQVNTGVNLRQVETPSQTAFFADVLASSELRPPTGNPRHNDKMNVPFVDGHTESLFVTDSRMQDINNPFWSGKRNN